MVLQNPLTVCTNADLPNEGVFPYLSIFLTLFVLVTFALSFRHALRTSRSNLLYLISASIFGYVLEITMISYTHSYCYNPHWIGLIGPVPLAIALSWGILIYNTHLIVERTNLSLFTGTLFQAFFTVILDFILDPVAIRFSLWTWGLDIKNNLPLFTKDYFGIPWGNYWGWHWAIFSFNVVFQLVSRFILDRTKFTQSVKDVIISLLSIALGMGVAFVIVMIFANYEKLVPGSLGQSLVIVALFLFDIALVAKEKLRFTQKIDNFARAVMWSFFVLFSAMWVPLATEISVLVVVITFCALIFYYILIFLPSKLDSSMATD